MKVMKNVKALSPVVASIILIAVTVAVSIAVAVWMGAISFTFMATEELQFTTHSWDDGLTNITITVKNTGASAVTILRSRVGDTVVDDEINTPILPGQSVPISIVPADTFESGVKYNFYFETARGNIFGPYQKVAP